MEESKILIIFLACMSFFIMPAYGDGLAGETLPPSLIGNRNVTFSINSSPLFIDNNHTGTQLNFALANTDDQQLLSKVTLSITALKGGKTQFSYIFKSDNGNFLINLIPEESGNITMKEMKGIFYEPDSPQGNYEIRGPIFNNGGLYKFKTEVLTMDSYENRVSKSYDFAISIPETIHYQIKNNGNQNITAIAYYDQLNNFYYDSDKKLLRFSMPFDWSDINLNQVTLIHQELKIPRSLTDFIVTNYVAKVNDIKLNNQVIKIDDYSSDDRFIHLILYKQDLFNLSRQQHDPKHTMNFTLTPSNETGFPITQFTNNAQYKVSLSWDPPKILSGSTATFSFQILDPYLINKTVNSAFYDFSILSGKNLPIFHASGKTDDKDQINTIEVPIPANYTGPITIAFDNLNGNSYANTKFSGAVSNVQIVPEFPSGILLFIAIIFSFVILLSRFLIARK